MNIKFLRYNSLFTLALCAMPTLHAKAAVAPANEQEIKQLITEKLDSNPKKDATDKNKTVRIAYNNTEIIDIINDFAAAKNVNVIPPTGANALTAKVTLTMENRLSLDEAWSLLYTILDIAGYTMLPKEDMFVVVKNSNLITKEPLPIYIATPIEKIPNSDERIRYLYYLTNLKVPSSDQEGASEINSVLKLMLDQTTAASDGSSKIVYDQATNGVLITDKANNIRAAVNILAELDRTGFKEVLEVVKILNTSADRVRDLLMDSKNGILTTKDEPGSQYQTVGKKTNDASYFSKNIKAYSEPRSNSLILLGRQEAIARVVKFIKEEIDRPLDPGRSMLHVYQLLYLDAQKAANILKKVIEQSSESSSGQSRATMTKGTERFFKNVLINADSYNEKSTDGRPGDFHAGSNKLLITCTNSDWEIIKRLIEELDIPQPQVILEVLVADITLEDPANKQIGSITRNPDNVPLFKRANFQAANLGGILLDPNGTQPTPDPTSLTPDLLSTFGGNGSFGDSAKSLAGTIIPGATAVALGEKNNGIWSFLQTLQEEGSLKILSNPHLIAINNEEATVSIGESRFVQGPAEANTSGTSIYKKNVPVYAKLTVKITPLINSNDQVNLKIKIDISEFTDSNSKDNANRLVRLINTEANIKSGEVLTLGGLIKTTNSETMSGTPVLSKLPIVGWLFKRRSLLTVRSNLTVFITPTIVQPKIRGGMSDYTQDYIKLTKRYAQDAGLFETLRDPITRWFFQSDLQVDIDSTIDKFTAIDELKSGEVGPDPTLAATEQEATPTVEIMPEMNEKVASLSPDDLHKEDVAFQQFVQQETGLVPFNLDSALLTAAQTPEEAANKEQEITTADSRKEEYAQQLKDLLQFDSNPFEALQA